MVQKSVGRYSLSKTLLGSGGYGHVLSARDVASGELLAVKVIETKEKSQESAVAHEVGLMKELAHPNIIGLRGFEVIGRDNYIFMELAAHGELFVRVLAHGNLSERDGRCFFAQIMSAVQFMHGKGIVHRDLKLENVLLDHKDRCKICDFGLAHRYDRDAQGKVIRKTLHEVCGSKSYAAPDVLVGGGYDGEAIDVWSCGICLFGMLAGFFPLDGATTSDWRFVRVCQAVIQGHSLTHTVFAFYGRPCPLSYEAVNLIDGMLSLNPSKRFTVLDVQTHAWLKARPPLTDVPDDQENLPLAADLPRHAAEKTPDYRHVAFSPVGESGVVGLGMQMSMELEACGVAAVAEWAATREVNSYAPPVYRGHAIDTFAAPTLVELPMSAELAGPPLPLKRQRPFFGALPEC